MRRIFTKGPWRSGLLAALLLAGAGCCAAQLDPTPLSQAGTTDAGISNQPTPPMMPSVLEKSGYSSNNATEAQIRMRQVYLAQAMQMVKDSKKLVEVAAKLNAEVASQHGGKLTPGELREVAQIEKLAHSVRTKMEAPVPSTLFQPESTNTSIYTPR